MKRIIYIDFENVSTAGLNGILDLDEKDHVKIFLGPKCSKLSLIEAEAILHCHATVELITNDQIGKNALDFIIMVHMGYDIAKKAGKAFYIVSNDKGYEPAIHEMQSMTGLTIERFSDIRQVLSESEPARGGWFGLFSKKNRQVQNTTEHEVYEKGKRVGQSRRSVRPDAEKKNSSAASRNNRSNSASEGSRRRPDANRKAQGTYRSGKQTGNKKEIPAQAHREIKPQEKPAEEPRSKAVLVKYNTETSVAKLPEPIAGVPAVAPSAPVHKKQKPRRPAPVSTEEKELVERAIAETSDKEAYHNYLMAKLHDTQRATELYKLSKQRFLKAREAAKPQESVPLGEGAVEQTAFTESEFRAEIE